MLHRFELKSFKIFSLEEVCNLPLLIMFLCPLLISAEAVTRPLYTLYRLGWRMR